MFLRCFFRCVFFDVFSGCVFDWLLNGAGAVLDDLLVPKR